MPKLSVLVLEGDYKLTSTTLFCLGKDPDIEIHFIGTVKNSPFRYSLYVKSNHYVSPEAPLEEFFKVAKLITEANSCKVLIPVDIAGMSFVIEHKEKLSKFITTALTPASVSFKIASDKGLLGKFLVENQLPGPDTIFDLTENLEENLANITFPVLLKPIVGTGGREIKLFADKAALLHFIEINNIKSNYIIQNCIEGYDIDCNVLYKNGVLQYYTIQKPIIPNTGRAFSPAEGIEFVKDDQVLDVVDQLMTRLSWNGVAHLDLRYDSKTREMKVIEINPRFWLTVIGSLETARVNFPALLAKYSADFPLPVQSSFYYGKYMPLIKLLKYKYLNNNRKKISFSLKDTSFGYVLSDPFFKLYYILSNSKVRKTHFPNSDNAAVESPTRNHRL